MEKKVIRDGNVAVIVSPGFGAGFVTWNDSISPFEPKIVKMVESGKKLEITSEWCKENLGIEDVYCGGVKDLEIVWIKKGSRFSINEYDGSESLYIDSELPYEA